MFHLPRFVTEESALHAILSAFGADWRSGLIVHVDAYDNGGGFVLAVSLAMRAAGICAGAGWVHKSAEKIASVACEVIAPDTGQ
jgi:hypothetical protein